MKADIVEKAYSEAKEYYSSLGVDTEEVLALMQAYDNPWLFSAPEVGQGRATDGLSREDCVKVILDVPGCKEQDASVLYNEALLQDKTDDERAEAIIAVITEARKAQKDYLRSLLPDAVKDDADDTMLDAIYNEFCVRNNVPVADEYISDVKNYI